MSSIEFSPERKKQLINDLMMYFEQERDEEIGLLAAEMMIDFLIDKIGGEVYNQALDDAKVWFSKKMDDIAVDYISLEIVDEK